MKTIYITQYTCTHCDTGDWAYWQPEPGDPCWLNIQQPIYLCDICRDRLERSWIVKATDEQLLTMFNYEWSPLPKRYPRYLMGLKELYQKRLAGERFDHIKEWIPYVNEWILHD